MRTLMISAFLMTGMPALAQVAPTPPKAEKKICKADVSSTSRMTKRICKTAKQWSRGGQQQEFDKLDLLDRTNMDAGKGVVGNAKPGG